MGEEVDGHYLGEKYNGYVFKIKGGNDKQGFPMKNGVFANHRVRVLMKQGNKCFRPRRDGERKRKYVRGCVCGPDLDVISLTIVKREIRNLLASLMRRSQDEEDQRVLEIFVRYSVSIGMMISESMLTRKKLSKETKLT